MTFIEMIRTYKKITDFFNPLESGSIASVLGDVELGAAKRAFEMMPIVNNKREQSVICSGHLNSSYEGYRTFVKSRTAANYCSVTQTMLVDAAKVKARFVCCLNAICYAYRSELPGCRQYMDLAQEELITDLSGPSQAVVGLWYFSTLIINPIPIVEGVVGFVSDAYPDTEKYKIELHDLTKLNDLLFPNV